MESRPSTPDKARLAAIVLAAGLSRRMGERNKLLLTLGGTALVRRSVTALTGYPFAEIVVVTGHQSTEIAAALDGLPVRVVHNAAYEAGQMTSVHAGMAALRHGQAGVMVCLADQPSLTAADVAFIADGFFARPGCPVLVPTFGGARGNPIVLGRASAKGILARGANFGCKQFITKNADIVRTLEMPNDHVLVDVDRPEDYEAALLEAGTATALVRADVPPPSDASLVASDAVKT